MDHKTQWTHSLQVANNLHISLDNKDSQDNQDT